MGTPRCCCREYKDHISSMEINLAIMSKNCMCLYLLFYQGFILGNPLLEIYTKVRLTRIQKNICIKVFTVSVSVIAEDQKQPDCPS